MVIGIWHFSFTVSNLERSITFYRDILGMELVHTQEQSNEYTRKLVAYPDAHLRVAQFKTPASTCSPSTHVLELVEYLAPQGTKIDTGTCNVGTAHVAFVVEDIFAAYHTWRGQGVRFKSEPVAIEAGINRGGYTVYFLDPDDITLEIVQPPPGRLTQAES
jgi:catechol 2,3-dioxygenase-like lactoylglutathione lyase family enzyme